VLNVVPRGDGYGPFPSLAAISASLGAQCRAPLRRSKPTARLWCSRRRRPTFSSSTIQRLHGRTCPRAAGLIRALSSGELWRFVQFNNLVIAVQANVVPQVFDVSSATAFADLAGSPPQARYVDIVGRFVVLTGLLSNPNRVQWSGLNDVNGVNSWTAGHQFERSARPGGWRLNPRHCRRRNRRHPARYHYSPHDLPCPAIRACSRLRKSRKGSASMRPIAWCAPARRCSFYSIKGFHRIDPGGPPVPIGRERVDRTFLADLDATSPGYSRALPIREARAGAVGL
jgi:hypothetical protein